MRRSKRHYRVTVEDVLAAHARELSINPGLPGLRDLGLLESAIARPYTGYYRSVHRKAAALVQSLIKNHAFLDGNKRTATHAMILFIHRSGYVLQPKQRRPGSRIERLNDEVVEMVLAVAESRLSFDELEQWFKDRIALANDRRRYFL